MVSFRLAAARQAGRFGAIDALRGLAIVAMVIYHLSWDFSAYGIVAIDVVNDPWWKAFAHLIAGTFLGLVGFNLVLAQKNGFRRAPYLRRLAILAGAAALVSLGTYLFSPDQFVYFGVLHEILVASVLALPFIRAPIWLTAIASVICLVLPELLTGPFFDAPWLVWLGLAANPIPSVDYVPVFPWFGIVLAGVACGRLFLAYGSEERLTGWSPTSLAGQTLALMGRWSLALYLIHQPIMVGIIYLWTAFIGVSDSALNDRFVNQCSVNCRSTGSGTREACASACTCMASESAKAGITVHVMSGRLTPEEETIWSGIMDRCPVPETMPPPAQ
jgi:uncharacterized membrane protein